MVTSQIIFEGVALGTIVALIVWSIRKLIWQLVSLINSFFIPRNLSGKWKTKFYKGEEDFDETVTVYQYLHWVWGKITYHKEGEIESRIYNFSGTLQENIFVATYEAKVRTRLDRGAFTLALNKSGDELEGMYCWTEDDQKEPEVQGDKYCWKRD